MNVTTVDVQLGERSYPILIGRELLAEPGVLQPWIGGDSVLIVTNETIAPLYLEQVRAAAAPARVSTCVLPDGERYKNLETLNKVFDEALRERLDRATTVIALGGGVIGDMAGFAAAVYQRGVAFIQVPTTLLAQVDSSVGGKTGVNHALGKNMIGAFHQPRAVLADIATLDTLDDRQLHAGLAEVIKYGLIADADFFGWLEHNMPTLLTREAAPLAEAIERSCRIKAEVVAADEFERGRRALLNLGHTFGHAIETATGYDSWLHGEAIAAGMCMAARMSEQLESIATGARERVEAIFRAAGLPVTCPPIGAERMRSLMAGDKKVVAGTIRLVLLDAIGTARVVDDYPPAALDERLREADIPAARGD
ncbi:MAG: 3-dehydroquinate synthase [Halofilum sp. (in: g-proteobacteria)]|nr:3-dehydroquinate synthase [Halofilum sp. (in: g-proteobacteria)]